MAPRNLAEKLLQSHLAFGQMHPGDEIGIRIDQTLTQDATGTLVALELESLGLQRVKTEVSVQYVDHNLLQTDFRNADDHLFLRSACRKFGIWYSPPGNGVSHPLHMERFGIPGKTLLGSDSHTCAAGSLGMLAIGAGGLEVGMAMAGLPFHLRMPRVLGVELVGKLPDWVSAKDVILEMLRRHGVKGGLGKIIEYHGSGLETLTAMDRHVIANMGAELGATTSIFPSDQNVRRFLKSQGREKDWVEILADNHCNYDEREQIDLSKLEPLIACPSSPGNVVPVREIAGKPIYQGYIGSSANPGLRDFAVPAMIVDGHKTHDRVSFDVNPTSRQILENMLELGIMQKLLHAGARIHQAGCNGCIGMGQAPATKQISLRTVPRNFPGRSGTADDLVYLCSPETVAASVLTGVITDPRTLSMPYPRFEEPRTLKLNAEMFTPPLPPAESAGAELEKGPNIASLPAFDTLPDNLQGPVLLKLSDNISTDEILSAGERVLPYRSNIPEISRFVFEGVDPTFYKRAIDLKDGFMIVAGENYGQGSSREHAALAPRFLGLKVVIAKSFARIHLQNLINFGVLPLHFVDPKDYGRIAPGDQLQLRKLRADLAGKGNIVITNLTQEFEFPTQHKMTQREIDMILAGSLINLLRSGESD